MEKEQMKNCCREGKKVIKNKNKDNIEIVCKTCGNEFKPLKQGKCIFIYSCEICKYRNNNYCEWSNKYIYNEDMEEYEWGHFPKWCKLSDSNKKE
ncbi:MAG: hypothetical protein HUJ88_11590 [Fusobacterium necrophorum]|nr:hypothetical protein [Fusobacterium necrophorum]